MCEGDSGDTFTRKIPLGPPSAAAEFWSERSEWAARWHGYRTKCPLFFLSFFCATYFFPRRVYATVLKLLMGSYVSQYIKKKKKIRGPPLPPKKNNFDGTKVKTHRRGYRSGPNFGR